MASFIPLPTLINEPKTVYRALPLKDFLLVMGLLLQRKGVCAFFLIADVVLNPLPDLPQIR